MEDREAKRIQEEHGSLAPKQDEAYAQCLER